MPNQRPKARQQQRNSDGKDEWFFHESTALTIMGGVSAGYKRADLFHSTTTIGGLKMAIG
jgi:hypothetical protein